MHDTMWRRQQQLQRTGHRTDDTYLVNMDTAPRHCMPTVWDTEFRIADNLVEADVFI